jgi:CRISPR/Cas system-associated exonuclease Cas4 (RecB family)
MTSNNCIPIANKFLKPLKHVSPTHLKSLKECKLRTILSSNGCPNLLPYSPSLRLGMVVHKVLEISSNNGVEKHQFEEIWEQAVKDQENKMTENWYESHLVPLSITALDFHVKKNQCMLLIKTNESLSLRQEVDRVKFLHEQWLQTKDGLVIGRADEIMFDGSSATIIDYKTGNVVDESNSENVTRQYQEQLKLYAALFLEEYGKMPDSLIIIGLDGKSHQIYFQKNECLSLLEQLKAILKEVNKTIETNEGVEQIQLALASPHQLICKYCHYRPICRPYFYARKDSLLKDWPNDTWGVVKDLKILQNGLAKVVLTPIFGNPPVSIRGLRLERHPEMKPGTNIAVFSLHSDGSVNSFKEGLFTTIYVLA